jgi:hypothetical protein
MGDYIGAYGHAGYGEIGIHQESGELIFQRNNLIVPLEHWHYDAWISQSGDFCGIAASHAFDRASHLLFETNAAGAIAAVSMRLEPAAAPIRFGKRVSAGGNIH